MCVPCMECGLYSCIGCITIVFLGVKMLLTPVRIPRYYYRINKITKCLSIWKSSLTTEEKNTIEEFINGSITFNTFRKTLVPSQDFDYSNNNITVGNTNYIIKLLLKNHNIKNMILFRYIC